MIDELAEYYEYTSNLVGGGNNHCRFIPIDNKMPNPIRAYEIIFRYVFSRLKEQDYIARTNHAFKAVEAWVCGDQETISSLSKNDISLFGNVSFPKEERKGYYRLWFENELNNPDNKKFRELNSHKRLCVYNPFNDTFKEFENIEALKQRLGFLASCVKGELRTNKYIFFPDKVLDVIKQKVLESYPTEKPSDRLFAGCLMLLGYYVAEYHTNKKHLPPRFIREDFQNWIGSASFIKNYWEKAGICGGIPGTKIFDIDRKLHRITGINPDIDLSLIAFGDMEELQDHLFSSIYVPKRGFYLVDRGSKVTYEDTVKEIAKYIKGQ